MICAECLFMRELKEDFHEKCCKQVPIKGMNFYRTRQCKNNALEDSQYCAVHDPRRNEERQEKKEKRFEERTRKKVNLYLTRLKYKAEGCRRPKRDNDDE